MELLCILCTIGFIIWICYKPVKITKYNELPNYDDDMLSKNHVYSSAKKDDCINIEFYEED